MRKMIMIIISILLFLAIGIGIAYLIINKDNKVKKEENTITTFNTQDHYIIDNANDTYLDKYLTSDKTMVIFFASWCIYCTQDAKEVNEYMLKNQDKNIIFVSHDKTLEDLTNYLETNSYNWHVIFDTSKTIREHIDITADSIPCAYVLDKNGNVISKLNENLNYDKLETLYNNKGEN